MFKDLTETSAKVEAMQRIVARLAVLPERAAPLAWRLVPEGTEEYYDGSFVKIGDVEAEFDALFVRLGCPNELYLTADSIETVDDIEQTFRLLAVLPLGLLGLGAVSNERDEIKPFFDALARYADEHPDMWPKQYETEVC